MNYILLFTLNAIVALALGVAFLLVPETMLGLFGAEQYAAFKFLAQFFGSAMIAFGWLLWLVKSVSDENMQKGIAYSLLVSSVLGVVITVIAMVADKALIRTNGWIVIIAYVLFALGYAFMIFMKPKMKE